ncbi:MAG: primosomal protein [Candidatus Paceibacterota bacterium]
MSGLLITEEVKNVEYLIEGSGENKKYSISGIFMQAETKNKNGRVYPKAILEREVNRYSSNYIAKNRAFGELGHPTSPTINLDRVSHMITELYCNGNNFMGKAKILDTPNGKIVKNLLDAGAQLGVSTRGVGTLKQENGIDMVTDDFYLATAADIVADPSAPEAFVRGIMENQEWIYNAGKWSEHEMDNAKKELREASRYDAETRALRLLENFLSRI